MKRREFMTAAMMAAAAIGSRGGPSNAASSSTGKSPEKWRGVNWAAGWC